MSTRTAEVRTGPTEWWAGARPRTLPAAVVPVAVGSAVAAAGGLLIWWRTALALVVSLALQVGTNYANDYSDGIRGSDVARVGPVRLVASGIAAPLAVKRAALLSFAVAAAAGLVLAVVTSPYVIVVGAACLAAGWFYTGGPRPYGYAGLGELFVFVFFGLVAVVGTAYVSLGRITALAVVAAVPVGLLAVGLLVVNNLRDLDNDARAGKRTLAVRMGEAWTRRLFDGCIVGALLGVIAAALLRPGALLAVAAVLFAAGPVRLVNRGARGSRLVDVLGMTGRLELVLGLLLAIGIAL
ncbi:MAG: 1,4-dihydroxy-2-naphthoate polyprenyltransferase [Acidimicrobiales bacterium]